MGMQLYKELVAADAAGNRANDCRLSNLGQIIRQVERMAQIGFWCWDMSSGQLGWSEEVFAIHDLPFGEAPGVEEALAFYPVSDRIRLTDALDQALGEGRGYDLELDFISSKGVKKRVRALGDPQIRDGRVVGVVGAFQDISVRYEVERRLEEASLTDDLTGLPNRRHFKRTFEAWESADFKPYAVALFDLDHFKQINDRFGHNAGDEVLRATAEALERASLKSSFAARLGGDEFAVFFTHPVHLQNIAETTNDLVSVLKQEVVARHQSIGVSGTVGVAVVETPGITMSQALSCADAALYAAKANGRGTGVISTPDDMFFGYQAA